MLKDFRMLYGSFFCYAFENPWLCWGFWIAFRVILKMPTIVIKLQEYRSKLQEYRSKLQEYEAKLQEYEAKLQEYEAKLQEYDVKLQEYASKKLRECNDKAQSPPPQETGSYD